MEASEEKKKSDCKRRMKTPSQLETLERAYAVDKYPSEGVRAELSVQLNLTDRQLQMWFCHRRLKDRKISDDGAAASGGGGGGGGSSAPAAAKKPKKSPAAASRSAPASSPPISPAEAPPAAPQQELFGGDFAPPPQAHPQQQLGVVIPPPKKASAKKKSQKSAAVAAVAAAAPVVGNSAELAVIRIVEQQLGEPLRDDGPVLGIEFDSLPPGAFDTPLESSDHQRMYSLDSLRQVSPAPEIQSLLGGPARPQMTTSRVPREHQFIPEHPTVAQFHLERGNAPAPKAERDIIKGKGPIVNPIIDTRMPSLSLNFFSPAMPEADSDEPPLPKAYAEIDRPVLPEPPVVSSKKRKSDDAKLARELEAQEKRLKKEAEKQEAARRKREEQERKELEKINRERQKELEKINRERQREEERHQREQKKEQDRLEKLAQREQQRLEKLRVKEEQRRQKEAAKLQAAYERATAKKLAKLSTGLLDDEQLELMQMGAFVQGLASEEEGGTGFDASKVELKRYPPASVRMKRVLSVPPWDSGQNVANLVMVWRFLTTFCDALGLWSFTVDEFVQGLHDFDSRLLNEIYMCLLKTLIKDVKDAAQAAASGAAGSQHAIAIAAGGHPQIVEAAYTWGFDIQEWGQHLTPLTWPEILRQFALAAGYGPRWKKRSAAADSKAEFSEMTEGHNANAIATLRSGAAAVNAVALMRGKNATRVKLKKGQTPKLTPGTVKYAAFHVLSIEGGKGLTILELTDRIQKSGLRDLSSSKTPEASISAALSRDTYLFERVAPSTYCVRSPFRRDSEDPEDVLQAAIERTYLYQTRHVDPDKLDEYADDPEDEYEAEEHELVEEGDNEAEEPEHDEAEANYEAAPAKAGKVIVRLKPGKPPGGGQEKEAPNHGECSSWPAEEKKISEEGRAEVEEEMRSSKPRLLECERKLEHEEEMDIDESQVGEPWVQGLMEGEFADLSIEERLNALVALVDVLNEGNTIRSILESRYEAASALKRQLWEEVQVDKRRLKEELTKSGGKAEAHEDERQNYGVEGDNNVASTSAPLSDKSRAQMKAEIRLRAEKLYVIRSLPLGLDRRYNRYWQFAASADDPENARIYFESNEDGHFEVIDTEEAFDALIASLDTRGVRESSLYTVLTHIDGKTRKAMRSLAQTRSAAESVKLEGSPSSGVSGPSEGSPPDVSSAISVELGRSKAEVQKAMNRYTDLDRWLWGKSLKKGKKRGFKAVKAGKTRESETLVSCGSCRAFFWPEEKHCLTCHTVVDCTNEGKFAQHVRECEEQAKSQGSSWQMNPSRLQLLKNLLLTVEARVPAEAFKGSWSDSRTNWCNNVRAANSAGELLHAFTELERAVDEQWLSSAYETTEKALGDCGESKNILPWVPQTTAAVCLRLRAFDAAIAFTPEQKKQLEQALHQNDAHHHQATPVVNPRRVEETSSPDSDSPPDFQNGHARLPPRPQSKSKPSARKPAAAARAAASQEQKRKRLSFRIQGRTIGGDGYHEQEQHQQQHSMMMMQQQQHHQQQHEQMMMEQDEKLASGNNEDDESSEEESESGDDREEYYDEMQQEDYQSQQHEPGLHHHHQDEERMKEHQQQYNNRMGYGDDEGSEEEEEYEEYEEEQNDAQQHQEQHHHHHPHHEEGVMMMDEEVEEVDEEEEDSEDDLSM